MERAAIKSKIFQLFELDKASFEIIFRFYLRSEMLKKFNIFELFRVSLSILLIF